MASRSPSSSSGAVTAVCLAVAALAVFGAMNSYQVSATYGQQFPDTYGVGRAQIRFAPALAKLPASAQLGYLTDLESTNANYSAAFLAAQYALAPRQLVQVGAMKPEFAVGNFSKPVDYAAAGEAKGYALAEDLGNGVVLFRRK